MRSQRESSAVRASWEVRNSSGMEASIEAVELVGDVEAGGELGSGGLCGDSWIT